ncbi:hypothetical protein AXE80_10500 [Wenyingzhuangia fucanilytica]|uniref:Polyketide cyclase n=1 Tax=Wenyingzhuangia fucanilytica TaxID=1790137 RepID=A0A1B1Y7D4_9FLAO|nr:SRPBCC family protein [Wenyingzhuangia fucanilytica]ANW96676.1 hypothetical protein AXE80_10500 [Wenyingzhuangia fucanilytica]
MIKKIIVVIAIVLGLYLIIGVIAPKDVSVEHTVEINKPLGEVFTYFDSLENMEEWSPWQKKGFKTVHEYINEDTSEGSIHRWASTDEDRGEAEHITKRVIKNKSITSDLNFKKPYKLVINESLEFEPTASGTNVTFTAETHYGFNESIKMMFSGVNKLIKKDVQDALTYAKDALESK